MISNTALHNNYDISFIKKTLCAIFGWVLSQKKNHQNGHITYVLPQSSSTKLLYKKIILINIEVTMEATSQKKNACKACMQLMPWELKKNNTT